jgi:Uma2 family endonuclease
MSAEAQFISIPKHSDTSKGKVSKANYISWTVFQNRYLTREDGFTYEWNNGTVEKSNTSMDFSQYYIWRNLFNFFKKLTLELAIEGYLVTEADIFLNEDMHRRPDIAYFTDAQINDAVKNKIQIPRFVAEVISPNDKGEKIKQKVKEYLEAGVEVVWNIYPNAQVVEVYEKNGKPSFCEDNQLCSANSIIPGFIISVNQ